MVYLFFVFLIFGTIRVCGQDECESVWLHKEGRATRGGMKSKCPALDRWNAFAFAFAFVLWHLTSASHHNEIRCRHTKHKN